MQYSFLQLEREKIMNESAFPRVGNGKILTLAEAAKYMHTSYSTVYRLVSDGELPAFRLRNAWRTSTAACDAYSKRQFEEQAKTTRRAEALF